MPRGENGTGSRPAGAQDNRPVECMHLTSTIVFKRNGTRLHPNVWMEERCIDCDLELDRKRVSRGLTDSYGRKGE